MSIIDDRQAWQRIRDLVAGLEAADDPISYVESKALLHQYELSDRCGLNTTTLRAIRNGKRATKAQKAALKFALLSRELNL